MTRRRDFILAGLGFAAVAGAEVLKPRRRLVLLRNTTIDATIPRDFGRWRAEDTGDLVGPEQAGRLAKALYSEIVQRIYRHADTGASVMLLAAYGDTQSDLLQLHRPESCYPAVGFALRGARSVLLPLPGGGDLPAREVIAYREERTESILYWARMGEVLPQTGGEQRKARLENAVHGFIPDGILVRCSMTGASNDTLPILNAFVPAMLEAIPESRRAALVGTKLARTIV